MENEFLLSDETVTAIEHFLDYNHRLLIDKQDILAFAVFSE